MNQIDLLLSKYMAGLATEKEQDQLEEWAGRSSKNSKILESFKAIKTSKVRAGHLEMDEGKFEGIYSKVHKNGLNGSHSNDWRSNLYIFKIAAMLVLITIPVWLAYDFLVPVFQEGELVESQYVEKTNPSGQRTMIHLPDGSTVWLNANSSVRYEKDFRDSLRRIHLKGEAFFNVKKDTSRAFVVNTGNTEVVALGTSFNINSYDPNEIKVSLATGKVKVSATGTNSPEDRILKPGSSLIYLSAQGKFQSTEFDYKKDILWTEGMLYFERAGFEEIIKKLERWYGVQFTIEFNGITVPPYTGDFDNESLENVLKSMSFSLDFDYSIRKKNIQLMFKEN